MNAAMNCAQIHERVVLAAYSELADDENHALLQHLAGCPACREEQQQLLALKTLSAAYPVLEPTPNMVARSRTRLEEALDALPPKRWYDRLGDWMTRTATGLQSAPVAACLLLVAGAGIGSLGGYEFAARHTAVLTGTPAPAPPETAAAKLQSETPEVANISSIVREPNSHLVEVHYNQVEPRQLQGTLDDPKIRQLLMLASQNGANPDVRNDSVELLASECRSGHGCSGTGAQGTAVRDALIVALRYDRSANVREKALLGLEPYVAEDMQVRDAVLEALMNDPEARIRSTAITMLQPVEADTSVRQVLSTVALSDENSHIRNASRLVLRRVSEVQ
jgi:hypothetical protein